MNHDDTPRAGDWLQARGLHGETGRVGEILEVLGRPGHRRYRVKWDERHESIVFPADGVSITHAARHRGGPAAADSPR
jgi:hypothetical protein